MMTMATEDQAASLLALSVSVSVFLYSGSLQILQASRILHR